MEFEEVKKILQAAPFRVAKSMPNIPHSYTRRREWSDEKQFVDVVVFIREHGVPEKFFSKTFIYLYIDGFKYWTMGSPLDETILINRAAA